MNAKDDLNLRGTHMSESTFSDFQVHLLAFIHDMITCLKPVFSLIFSVSGQNPQGQNDGILLCLQ